MPRIWKIVSISSASCVALLQRQYSVRPEYAARLRAPNETAQTGFGKERASRLTRSLFCFRSSRIIPLVNSDQRRRTNDERPMSGSQKPETGNQKPAQVTLA